MPLSPVACITGISGQDGYYLTELLLSKGYTVHGLISFNSQATFDLTNSPVQLSKFSGPVHLHYVDFAEDINFGELFGRIQPTELFHLAGQSDVRMSFELPQQTAEVNVLGTIRLLEGVRHYQEQSGRELRCFQSTSSEMFGKTLVSPQNERTPFSPCTPYGCTKVYDFWQGVNYREAYGMFICNGILYNHESPRRGEMYVTRKITRAATRIKLGLQKKLYLGNLASRRDWGFSGDYVRAMWLMLQHDQPEDYILATGQLHSLEEFLQEVFGYLKLDWREYVETDAALYRPAEVGRLFGDASKARKLLDWEPEVDFRRLAQMMTDHDLRLAQTEL